MRYLKLFFIMVVCSATFALILYLISNKEQAKEAILPQEQDRSFRMPAVQKEAVSNDKKEDETVGDGANTAPVPTEEDLFENLESENLEDAAGVEPETIEIPDFDDIVPEQNQLF